MTKHNREEWEETFEYQIASPELFVALIRKSYGANIQTLKDFIHENFVSKDELRRVLDGMKRIEIKEPNTDDMEILGYNAALEAIRQELNLWTPQEV